MSNAMTPQRNEDSKCFLAKAMKDTMKGKEINPNSREPTTSDDNQKFKDAIPRGMKDSVSIINPNYKSFDNTTRFKPNTAQDDTKIEGNSCFRSLTKTDNVKEQRNIHKLLFIPKRNEINSLSGNKDHKDDVKNITQNHEVNTLAPSNTKIKPSYLGGMLQTEWLPAIKPSGLEDHYASNSHFKEPAASEKHDHFLKDICHEDNGTVGLRNVPDEKSSQNKFHSERDMKTQITANNIIEAEPEDTKNTL